MKTITSFNRLLFAALCSSLLFSCQKQTSESELSPEQEEATSAAIAQSQVESEIVFNDVFDNVIGVNAEVGIEGVGVFGRTSAST